MKIWLLQTGEPIQIDDGDIRPMRAINLSNKLIEKGHQVNLFTSTYFHQQKRFRFKEFKEIIVNDNLKITLIKSPGYKKNISIGRILDHIALGKNLSKYLKNTSDEPDIAFIGYPPIESAYVFINWLKKREIPVFLDIKDQWPSIFIDRMPIQFKHFLKFLLMPYNYIAIQTINSATGIITISDAFLKWSRVFSDSQSSNLDRVSYLTAPEKSFSPSELDGASTWLNKTDLASKNKFRVLFIGSFSRSFDFETVLNAAQQLELNDVQCEFIFCGYGELFDDFKKQSKRNNNVKLFGFVDQAKIFELSRMASMFIAPYKNSEDFMMSIPNKVIDALRMGLPILTPLKGEVKKITQKNNIGFFYEDSSSLAKCIEASINDSKMLNLMSNNAKKLYADQFDFNLVYDGLVDHIENLTLEKMESKISRLNELVNSISRIRKTQSKNNSKTNIFAK